MDKQALHPKVAADERSGWELGEFDLDLIEGDPRIEIVVLETGIHGAPITGFAKGWPSIFDSRLSSFETVHVIKGRARVEVGGAVVDLGPGDATTFPPGVVARWTIHEPLLEFFQLSPISTATTGS